MAGGLLGIGAVKNGERESAGALGGAADGGHEFGGIDGFSEVVLEAGGEGFDTVFGAGVGGEGDGGGLAAVVSAGAARGYGG